jgi:hypothetical protein
VTTRFGKNAIVVKVLKGRSRQGMKNRNASAANFEEVEKKGAIAGEVEVMGHGIGVSN